MRVLSDRNCTTLFRLISRKRLKLPSCSSSIELFAPALQDPVGSGLFTSFHFTCVLADLAISRNSPSGPKRWSDTGPQIWCRCVANRYSLDGCDPVSLHHHFTRTLHNKLQPHSATCTVVDTLFDTFDSAACDVGGGALDRAAAYEGIYSCCHAIGCYT